MHSALSASTSRRFVSALVAGVAVTALASGCGKTTPSLPEPNPSKASAELAAGLQAQTKGQLDSAATHFQETLKYDPKNKYALYNLALIDASESKTADAESKYRIVLGIDPNYVPALFNLAILVKNKGDSGEALSLYRRVIVAKPTYAAAHMNLGLLLRATGDAADGNAEVHKAITLDPQLKDPAAKP
jgi:tetratricopeptide (TPR) repeat protein